MDDVSTDAPAKPSGDKHVPKHAPRKGSRPTTAKKGWFRRYWWIFPVVPLVLIVGVLVSLFVAYQRVVLPEALPPIRSTFLYDRNGDIIASLHGSVDRTIVGLGKISPNLQHAVLATEDAGFYQHPGIDVKGIISAAWTDIVKRETVVGASTITQQLVKNVYAGQYVEQADGTTEYVVPPRTVKAKIREALLAIKLEHTYTKDQILAKYLNTVYFGHGAYGAEAAARTYFGKPASELTVLEAATLSAVLHAPSLYDPIDSPYDNKFRRDYSLDQMARYGYITQAEADRLKAKACCGTIPDAQAQIKAPHGSAYFVDYTRQYLIEKYGGAKVFGGGLRVTTSLDMDKQAAALDAVNAHLPDTDYNPDAALVSIDTQTGQILAMVGGRNFNKSKLNLATFKGGTGRQAGSAFKAFTLAAAMKEGFNLNAYWQGPATISIPDPRCDGPDGPWTPENAGDGEAGTFTLAAATAHSVNTVFAQLVTTLDGGPQDVVDAAHALGIRSHLDALCSITLGSVAVNPLEMTNAYSSLATRGERFRATPLVQIASQSGRVIDDVTQKGKQVLDQNDADLVTYALRGVVTGGTGYSAGLADRPVAGKTGTAQDNADAWFCGYTPQIATCVWVGYPEGAKPLLNVMGVPAVYGGTIPAAIWHDYMTAAMQGMPVEQFATPSFVGYDRGPEAAVASPTPSPTPTPSPSAEPSPSETPSPTPTESPSPSESPTPTPTPSGTPSPTKAPTAPAVTPQRAHAHPHRWRSP
jgi:penicillin-binding protein 1A